MDPLDDLEEWSDKINEFMDGLCRPLPSDLVDKFKQWTDDIGTRVEMGLPTPDSYTLRLSNSATMFREATNSKLLSDLEKDPDSLLLLRKEEAINLQKAPTFDSIDPKTNCRDHIPPDYVLTI